MLTSNRKSNSGRFTSEGFVDTSRGETSVDYITVKSRNGAYLFTGLFLAVLIFGLIYLFNVDPQFLNQVRNLVVMILY